MTLYELAADLRDLYEALDECETDEQVNELMDAAVTLGENIRDKAEGYVKLMRTMQTDADALDSEIKRLQQRKKRREDAVERLKARMLDAMRLAEVEKIETPLGKWSRRFAPWSVTITDPEEVPDIYLIPQPPTIDKRQILSDFKRTGEALPGCEFQQREYVSFR
ncbi:MAG: siphovirus Gp157 family protein [Clostridia bacterium]|nr:siphovirus Gp157 family protein [Clostridia bacterium]